MDEFCEWLSATLCDQIKPEIYHPFAQLHIFYYRAQKLVIASISHDVQKQNEVLDVLMALFVSSIYQQFIMWNVFDLN